MTLLAFHPDALHMSPVDRRRVSAIPATRRSCSSDTRQPCSRDASRIAGAPLGTPNPDQEHTMNATLEPTLSTDEVDPVASSETQPALPPNPDDALNEYVVIADDDHEHDAFHVVGRYRATGPHEARLAHVREGDYTPEEKDAGIPLRAIAATNWDRALKTIKRKVTEELV